MPGKVRAAGTIKLKSELIFWGLISGSVFLDIFTKFLSQRGVFRNIPVLNGQVENKGASFGVGSGLPPGVLLTIGILLIVVLLVYRYRHISFKSDLVIAILIGGALGNQYDRFRFGHVRDFIQWPVFNVADILICVGVGFYIIDTLYTEKYKSSDSKSDDSNPKDKNEKPGNKKD